MFPNHRAWADTLIGMDAVVQTYLNPIIHHCAIGKITLKQPHSV